MAAKRVIKSHANRALHSQLVHRFFSRDPKQWPVFGLPDVARTVEHLRRTENEKYPTPAAHESAEDLQRHMARFSDLNIPQHMAEDGRQATDFTAFVSRYTKNWMSPRSVENVASACSDPGALLCRVRCQQRWELRHAAHSHHGPCVWRGGQC